MLMEVESHPLIPYRMKMKQAMVVDVHKSQTFSLANTDLQVNRSISHLSLTVQNARDKEKAREREKPQERARKKNVSGSVESNSCHTLFIQ